VFLMGGGPWGVRWRAGDARQTLVGGCRGTLTSPLGPSHFPEPGGEPFRGLGWKKPGWVGALTAQRMGNFLASRPDLLLSLRWLWKPGLVPRQRTH
jgi:hypothetical protein